MTESRSRDAAYFDRMYETNIDPWNFRGSEYEQRKYDATIAALGERHFHNGIEVGCSIGVLTARFAECCDRLLGADLAPLALAEAERRCAHLPHVRFERRQMPEDWPDEAFDLIVFSEVLYFLTPADNSRIASLTRGSIQPKGLVVLVNFIEQIDEPCSGEEAAALFISATTPNLKVVHQYVDARFRIDVLQA